VQDGPPGAVVRGVSQDWNEMPDQEKEFVIR